MRILCLQLLLTLSFIYKTYAMANTESYDNEASGLLIRKARWLPLIYPRGNPTRFQFITGFGIPVEDLTIEAITTGYVFKAQYYLPYEAKQLRTKNVYSITARQQQDNATIFQQMLAKTDEELGLPDNIIQEDKHALSSYRWAVYKAFEALGARMQLNGRECVLKSICESATAPFDERNGLLGELMHILLTSMDELSLHTDNDYLQAEHLGHVGADCQQVYGNCPRSLLDHFSDVHDWGSDFLKMLA